jgi:hypothetical protein
MLNQPNELERLQSMAALGVNCSACAESGFDRLPSLLAAIESFAISTGARHIAVIASEGSFIARNFGDLAGNDKKEFERVNAEVSHD